MPRCLTEKVVFFYREYSTASSERFQGARHQRCFGDGNGDGDASDAGFEVCTAMRVSDEDWIR